MKDGIKNLYNVLCISFFTLVLATVQTSFWPNIFPVLPPPLLWLPAICFLSLFRKPVEGILVSYFIALTMSAFSRMPFALLALSFLTVLIFIQLIKQRIFWRGANYFFIICGLSTLVFHIAHFLLAFLLESRPTSQSDWLNWLYHLVLTPIFSYPIYYLLSWIDLFTDKTPLIETGRVKI